MSSKDGEKNAFDLEWKEILDDIENEDVKKQKKDLKARTKAPTKTEETELRKSKYPVVVIGCGASGVACLSKLAKDNIEAVGLEASTEIGGRICTVDFGQGVVDLGAAWCHGVKNNIVYNLANPLDLLGSPAPPTPNTEYEWFILSDGSLMPHGIAKTTLNIIKDQIDNFPIHDYVKPNMSISEFIKHERFPKTIIACEGKKKKNSPPITAHFIEWYERENHLGGEIDTRTGKSLLGLREHEDCPGEFWLNWKGRGYKTILDVLMGTHPSQAALPARPLNIQFNKEVTEICWNVANPQNDDPVLVKCADGSEVKASRVVVTVSLGVLKERHATLFKPALPETKVSAINNLQFCILDKIYIEFESAWWPEGLTSFKVLWRVEDKAKFEGDLKWVTGIYGFRAVEHQPRVLLAWLYGTHAEEMEKVDVGTVKQGVCKLLDNFKLNFKVTAVTDIKRSRWASNQLIRGAYSYRAVTTEDAQVGAKDLATPLESNGEVVYFAGEAASIRWHNSVHGAIDAGFCAAEKIKASMQIK